MENTHVYTVLITYNSITYKNPYSRLASKNTKFSELASYSPNSATLTSVWLTETRQERLLQI